jgi:hypothetical protein
VGASVHRRRPTTATTETRSPLVVSGHFWPKLTFIFLLFVAKQPTTDPPTTATTKKKKFKKIFVVHKQTPALKVVRKPYLLSFFPFANRIY